MQTESVEQTEPETTRGELTVEFDLGEIEERQEHRAACPDEDCGRAVTFRKNATGTGFIEIARHGIELETTVGAGLTGLPVCPKHDVEMVYADEQLLPAADAITQVAGQIEAQRLPFPVPAYNYAGVLESLIKKRHEIARLETKVEEKADALKKAKTDLANENLLLGKMLDQYEQDEQDRNHAIARREAAVARGEDPDAAPAPESRLVKCVYEQQHPGETCPLCDPNTDQALIERACGTVAARDSHTHLDQVGMIEDQLGIEAVLTALENVLVIPEATIRSWTPEQRDAVIDWTFNRADAPETPRPSVLGTSHIAAEPAEGVLFQVCRECDDTILQLDGDTLPYATGLPVGTNCQGPGTHHLDTTPKKRKAKQSEDAKPKAAKPAGKKKAKR